jgi:hypothetical protein
MASTKNSNQKVLNDWWKDMRLPEEERKEFLNKYDVLVQGLTLLQKVTGTGPWTFEADMLEIRNFGRRAPQRYLADNIYPTVPDFAGWLEGRFAENPGLKAKFNAATKNKKVVLNIGNSDEMDNYCETEFKNGDMIWVLKDFVNLCDWGMDVEVMLEKNSAQSETVKGAPLQQRLAEQILQDITRGHGNTPQKAIQTLLDLDAADLPLVDKNSYPLHTLVYWGLDELAEQLKPGVKNPNVRDEDGKTPLILACSRPEDMKWQFVEEERRKLTPMIKALLKFPGIDVNAQDRHGRTALMYVARSHDWDDAAELLVADSRVDFNFENSKMENALDLAQEFKFTWLAKVLTKHKNEGTKPSSGVKGVPSAPAPPSAPVSAPKGFPKIASTSSTVPAPPKAPVSPKKFGSVTSTVPPTQPKAFNNTRVPPSPPLASAAKKSTTSAATFGSANKTGDAKHLVKELMEVYGKLQ